MSQGLFTVGSVTSINGEDWRVTRYVRVKGKHAVEFANTNSGQKTVIPITTLQTHVKEAPRHA